MTQPAFNGALFSAAEVASLPRGEKTEEVWTNSPCTLAAIEATAELSLSGIGRRAKRREEARGTKVFRSG